MKNPHSTFENTLSTRAKSLGTALTLTLSFAAILNAETVVKFGGLPVVAGDLNTTWTCPAGVTSIKVECWGGGGAGGAAQNTAGTAINVGGGGGAGGCYAKRDVIPVTPGNTYTIFIPDRVVNTTVADGARVNGGTVSFTGDLGVTVTAVGGQGGQSKVSATAATGLGGIADTTGCVGDVIRPGGNGGSATTAGRGGMGGSAPSDLANGNNAVTNPASSSTQNTAPTGSDADHTGGNGAAGRITVAAGNIGGTPSGGGGGAMVSAAGASFNSQSAGKGQILITYGVANVKANNANNLNLASSWTVGLPGPTEVAKWNNTVTSANTTVLGADLTFQGIQILDPNGTVTINGANTLSLGSAATKDIELAGTADLNLNCNLATNAANEWDVTTARTLTIGGVVSGPNTVTKKGSGTVVLTGNNSYSDTTTISTGTLNIQHANALGNTAAFTEIANSAGMLLQGGISFAAEPLLITSGTATTAQLRNVSGDNTWNGTIDTTGTSTAVRIASESGLLTLAGTLTGFSASTTLALQGEGNITVSGKITGVSPLASSNLNNAGVAGTTLGTRTLTNTSNDFTGTVAFNGGTLVLGGAGTSGSTSNNLTGGGGRLDLGGFSHTVGTLSVNTAPASGDAISNGSLTATSYAATNGTGTAIISANLLANASAGFTKSNGGTVILSGTNTYTGPTTVNAGALRVNFPGSLAATSTVTANGTSTIGGSGTIGGSAAITAKAKLAPGDTAVVGTLTIGGNLDLSAPAADTAVDKGIFTFQLDTSAASDKVAAGTLTIGSGALGINDFLFENLAGFGAGTYKLITTTGGISGSLDAADLTGTINALAVTLRINGNDLELVVGGNYASWATANGITGEAFGSDFDKDGISNGVEYALGLNPSTSSQPPGALSGNTITFTKGAEAIANGDVSWTIETSTTLAAGSWTDAVIQSVGDPAPTIAYTFTPGTPAKKFARLKIIQVP